VNVKVKKLVRWNRLSCGENTKNKGGGGGSGKRAKRVEGKSGTGDPESVGINPQAFFLTAMPA